MTHFANANNILSAIGARPRIGRPNFPIAPGLHPAEVLVALHPFDKSTIDHFVFLERPDGVDEPDGAAFVHDRSYVRATTEQTMMPTAQDFDMEGRLAARMARLDARIEETYGQAESAELSARDYANFFRYLGGLRGLSESGIGFIKVAKTVDWARWREARF